MDSAAVDVLAAGILEADDVVVKALLEAFVARIVFGGAPEHLHHISVLAHAPRPRPRTTQPHRPGFTDNVHV